MIALAKVSEHRQRSPEWQTGFLEMLPKIRGYARAAFRNQDPESREEAVQEIVVSSMKAYVRLWTLGKQDLAYPSLLARFAIAQYRSGRRVGVKSNCRDVLSDYAQQKHKLRIESLDGQCDNGEWREALVESKQAGPAEMAASRIDFAAWLDQLSSKRRRVALILALGETTSAAARKVRVSRGRISQLRRELLESWHSYHGEPAPAV